MINAFLFSHLRISADWINILLSFFLEECKVSKLNTKTFPPQGYLYSCSFWARNHWDSKLWSSFLFTSWNMSQYDLLSLAHWKFHFPQIQAFHVLHFAVSEYHEGKVHYQPHVYSTKKTQKTSCTNVTTIAGYNLNQWCSVVEGPLIRGHFGHLQGLPGFHNNPEPR